MFSTPGRWMLASMSERADTPPLNWSEWGVSELPTGKVTLLLADVEGSTRLCYREILRTYIRYG
jgi:class 3 adenylate cyclase